MLHHAGPGPRTPSRAPRARAPRARAPRARAPRARALAVATACALLVTACGGSRAGGSAGGGRLTVSYEAAKARDVRDRDFLRGRRLAERVADDLNRALRLPRDIAVTGRSCPEGDFPDYDPETGRVTLCYGYVGEVRSMFQDAEETRDDAGERTAGVVTETLYHELAHALIHRLDLRFTGHEEDVADQFAAYRLIPRGAAGRAALRAAADNYAQYAADSDPSDDDPSDEHAPDAARSANYLCYLYGSAPGRDKKLVDGKRLTKDRAEQCEDEYAALRRGWDALLAPHAR
ncbi:DUF4344 domain-containing metallopeptidase [Streptomyces caatingaensis]|uniref:DUF4344 domain-containing metallopeptidase n=1 Tax=Streptomyces caatingaensis TaxID=1678637 RepID=UPI000A420408|nr:DUF4344 domain-containing metallopeptidase [Streptomyces caatingaensis]